MTLKGILNLLMSFTARKHLYAFLCILIIAHVAMAQDSVSPNMERADVQGNPGRSLEPGTSQLGFWAGYSASNPTLIGRTTNRPLFEFNVQYAHVLETGDNWALKYTAEIIPVVLIKQPQQGYAANGDPVDLPGSQQKIYGAGVSPVGLQMNFRRGSVLQPYVNGTAGVIYFTDQVPVADSSNFNFTFGFGAGVEIWHLENQSIILGYKYQHISNGYTAPHNPGVDSNLFYVGYAWSWTR
ncbi:MAG TPA: acyloxyacyl hydrolase [Nitrospirota bacterium]|nr:acyloxyacyl hydrolase [Nitrospirota bacterium]